MFLPAMVVSQKSTSRKLVCALTPPAFGAALSLAPHPRSRDWKLSAPFATGYATVNKISNIVNHRVLA